MNKTRFDVYPWGFLEYLTRAINFAQRKVYGTWLRRFSDFAPLPSDYVGEECNHVIYNMLTSPDPCMITRFGGVELFGILRTYARDQKKSNLGQFFKMCLGKSAPFWWENAARGALAWDAGFFPPTDENIERFGRLVLEDSRQIDLVGASQCGEKMLKKVYFPEAKAVWLEDLEPFFSQNPWTLALSGRKVLIVHPFDQTIQSQYQKSRIKSIHHDARLLPDFDLKVYRTVQSIGGNKPPEFETWFDALDKMCTDISKIDFDIAIIGAGAYGMSLAAFIKRNLRKKAFHLGGATQLLFGIKGRRYDQRPIYSESLYTEDWVYATERPDNYRAVEDKGPYW